MAILNKYLSVIIAIVMVMNNSVQALDQNLLTEEEKAAVEKLGMTAEQLKSIDVNDLKDLLKGKLSTIKNDLKDYAQNRLEEVADYYLEKEKKDLKKQAVKIGIGYTLSTLSLFAATLIAPQALMVCKTKPSVVIYAGTSAAYLLLEMLNVKKLKADQLAEIEIVDGIKIDTKKGLQENANALLGKVDQQVGYLVTYKKALEYTIKALRKKAKNAKMVSIGFLAASAAAAAEQMNLLSGGGACVVSHEKTPNIKEMNFDPKVDQFYADKIEKAEKMEDRWRMFYEWEAIKLGRNQIPLASDRESLPQTFVPPFIFKAAMVVMSLGFLESALAEESGVESDNGIKKIMLIPEFKDNKAANWLVDLDKLGIVGGVATHLIAYMTGWQMGFLKSIMASGTSRSLTFAAQAALAFSAGTLFESAVKKLQAKLDWLEDLVLKLQKGISWGMKILIPTEAEAKKIQNILNRLGLLNEKLITEMSLEEAYDYLKQAKNKLSDKVKDINYKDVYNQAKSTAENFNKEDLDVILHYEKLLEEKLKNPEELKQDLQKGIEKLPSITSSFIRKIFWFEDAYAEDPRGMRSEVFQRVSDLDCDKKKSCPPLIFSKVNSFELRPLNQVLTLYEKYYHAETNGNELQANRLGHLLLDNKEKFENYRNYLFFKKKKNKDEHFKKLQDLTIENEKKKFLKFYNALPTSAQQELAQGFSPDAEGNRKTSRPPTLNSREIKIIDRLILKLEDKNYIDIDIKKKTQFAAIEEKSDNSIDEKLDFGMINIHSKEQNLFEIIHSRYMKVFKNE